ncbi:MAG: hypothetical protein H6579_09825 [Chitinophagales bacterium]|nr:hypothetical protein [Chitinophagales bacterium]
MKKSLLILFILTFTFCVYSQKIPEPDFSSRPYYLQEDGNLKSLERTSATTDVKVKGIYRGAEVYFSAFSAKSKIQFHVNEIPRIFIKLDQNIDPYEIVSLVKAEVQKDRRRFLQRDQALGGKVRDVSDVLIELEFKKIREGLWEIFLPNNLGNGEYGFMPMNNLTETMSTNFYISCFGIHGSEDNEENSQSNSQNKSTNNLKSSPSYSNYDEGISHRIRGGFGFSRGVYWGPQFTPSFMLGWELEVPLFKDYLSLQTGADFQKFGGIDKIWSTALHLYYLRIPAMAKGGYRFNNGMKIFAGLGPNFGIGIAGVVKDGNYKQTAFSKRASSNGFNYSRFDMGIGFDLGIEINNRMIVSMTTINGIVDYDKTFDIEKNKSISFNFSYKIGSINKKKGELNNTTTKINNSTYQYKEETEDHECNVCHGSGYNLSTNNVLCRNQCNKGLLSCSTCNGSGNGKSLGNKFNPQTKSIEQVYEKCAICNGSGQTTCGTCKGEGFEILEQKLVCETCKGKGKI